MKNIKIIISVVFFLIQISLIQAQKIDFPKDKSGSISYEGVINVEGLSKKEIYNQAIDWFVLNYKSSNDVIQLRDIDRAKIIGKGVFNINHWMGNKWQVNHTITIKVKDGRFKYTINQISFYTLDMKSSCAKNINMNQEKNKCIGKNSFYKLKVKIHNNINTIIENLELSMKSSASRNDDDDDDDDSW